MFIKDLNISKLKLVEQHAFEDNRGFFSRLFCILSIEISGKIILILMEQLVLLLLEMKRLTQSMV